MTQPLYIVRSYGGGAVPVQLVNEIGASDASFTIAATTDWTDINGNPLGTTGPFVVVIDRFTPTVEKILCSSINLTTGVVDVYNSGGFFGRGYDDTTAQGHIPNGSAAGVQTCWSAVEAFEANAAVSYLLGTAGGTPTSGQILTWGSGAPTWGAPVTAQPSARVYRAASFAYSGGGTPTLLTFDTVEFDSASAYSTGTGLYTVPSTGKYLVIAVISFNITVTGWVQTQIYKNGVEIAVGNVAGYAGTPGTYTSLATTMDEFAATDTIGAYGNSSSSPTGTPGSATAYMSIVRQQA